MIQKGDFTPFLITISDQTAGISLLLISEADKFMG
jgi:hypothetical protein